jgi:hypothetical protein
MRDNYVLWGEMAPWLHVGTAFVLGTIGLGIAMVRSYINAKEHEEEMEQLREELAKRKEEQKNEKNK